jgi:hypothetical protein
MMASETNDTQRLPYGVPRMPYDAQAVMTMLQYPERYTSAQRAYAAARAQAIWREIEPGYVAVLAALKRDLVVAWDDAQGVLCDVFAQEKDDDDGE